MTEAETAITGIASSGGVCADPAQRLDAVDVGQLDVHQDQVGRRSQRQPHAVLRR